MNNRMKMTHSARITEKHKMPNKTICKHELLDLIKSKQSICWYPSAGGDFRPLLYLSDAFYDTCSDNNWFMYDYPKEDKIIPDLFILSDYKPSFFPSSKANQGSKYFREHCGVELLNNQWSAIKKLYSDTRVSLKVKRIAQCKNVIQDFNDEIVRFERSGNYGSAFMMRVSVYVNRFGREHRWETDVLYIIGENSIVERDFLLKNHIPVETVITIRYGEAFGESMLDGNWIIRILNGLQTRYWITNGNYVTTSNTDAERFPDHFKSFSLGDIPKFKQIYGIDGLYWSNYGPVYWMKLNREGEPDPEIQT